MDHLAFLLLVGRAQGSLLLSLLRGEHVHVQGTLEEVVIETRSGSGHTWVHDGSGQGVLALPLVRLERHRSPVPIREVHNSLVYLVLGEFVHALVVEVVLLTHQRGDLVLFILRRIE